MFCSLIEKSHNTCSYACCKKACDTSLTLSYLDNACASNFRSKSLFVHSDCKEKRKKKKKTLRGCDERYVEIKRKALMNTPMSCNLGHDCSELMRKLKIKAQKNILVYFFGIWMQFKTPPTPMLFSDHQNITQ